MTKAERIRAIAKAYPELSTAEIGERAGCDAAYVRVVTRQRVGGSRSESDRRYDENFSARHGVSRWTAWRKRRREASHA